LTAAVHRQVVVVVETIRLAQVMRPARRPCSDGSSVPRGASTTPIPSSAFGPAKARTRFVQDAVVVEKLLDPLHREQALDQTRVVEVERAEHHAPVKAGGNSAHSWSARGVPQVSTMFRRASGPTR